MQYLLQQPYQRHLHHYVWHFLQITRLLWHQVWDLMHILHTQYVCLWLKQVFKIRGKGIRTSRGVGNLFLHIVVEVPKLSREQKKQLEKVYEEIGLKQQEQMKKYADNMEALYGETPY